MNIDEVVNNMASMSSQCSLRLVVFMAESVAQSQWLDNTPITKVEVQEHLCVCFIILKRVLHMLIYSKVI